jgi:hypothetical protein
MSNIADIANIEDSKYARYSVIFQLCQI